MIFTKTKETEKQEFMAQTRIKLTAGIGFLFIMGSVMAGCQGGSEKSVGNSDTTQMENADGQSGQQNARKKLQRQSNVDTNVSDEKLKQYAEARSKMQSIRKQNMPQMQQAIKDAGLTMKRYRAIMQQQKGRGQGQGQGQGSNSVNVSDAEMKKFKEAQKNIRELQKQAREKMMSALEEVGLSQQEFQRIGRAIQSSESLQQKMRKMQGGKQQRPQMQRQGQ